MNTKRISKILVTAIAVALVFSIGFLAVFSTATKAAPANAAATGVKATIKGNPFSMTNYQINKIYQNTVPSEKEKRNNKISKNLTGVTSSVNTLVNGLASSGWEGQAIFNTAMDTAKSLAALVPVWGVLISGVVDLFQSLMNTFSASSQQSEMERLMDQINERFDEMDGRFDEMQAEFDDLSNQVADSTEQILAALSSELDNFYAKEQINDFFSNTDGAFSYTQFKNYIYGSDSAKENPFQYGQAYYSKLISAIRAGQAEKTIKKQYDNLFKVLAGTNAFGSSNISILNDYIISDQYIGDESIIHYYYEYLVSNQDLLGDKSAEYEALAFAFELYNTAITANYLVSCCNNYQMAMIVEEYGENTNDLVEYVTAYGTTISFGEANQGATALTTMAECFINQMVKDITYIFNAAGSYLVSDADGYFREVCDGEERTYGQVRQGQTIYLNQIPDYYLNQFDIDKREVEYVFVDNGVTISTENGMYTVGANVETFSGVMKYQGEEVYRIDFEVDNDDVFSGGSGTADNPYLIASAEQFAMIGRMDRGLEKHYALLNDIDFEGAEVVPAGDRTHYFRGGLDGNGYTLKNFKISTTGEEASLFNYIDSKAVIQNLIIDNASLSLEATDIEKTSLAVIAVENYGVIYNCIVKNSNVTTCVQTNQPNKTVVTRAAGIAASNYGDIRYSQVLGTAIAGDITHSYGGNPDNENATNAYVGGVVAILSAGAGIDNCYVDSQTSLSVFATAKCADFWNKRAPYVEVLAGGITAKYNTSSLIDNVFSEVVVERCGYSRQNNKGALGVSAHHATKRQDRYVAQEQIVEGILSSSSQLEKASARINEDFGYDFASSVLSDADYGCKTDQIYDCGTFLLKTDNLLITLDQKPVDYSILSYYAFDGINKDKENVKNDEVIVVFSTVVNGDLVIDSIVLPVIIRENKPVDLVVEVQPTKKEYAKDEALDHSGAIYNLIYQDGSVENVRDSADLTVSGDTSQYGYRAITLTHSGISETFEVHVSCEHSWSEAEVVAPTCTTRGYTKQTCSYCQAENQYSVQQKLAHTPVSRNVVAPGCETLGYTGDIYCLECNAFLEEGESIPATGHSHVNDDDYVDRDNTHRCEQCNFGEEQHEYSSTEVLGKIIYTCMICGYMREEDCNNANNVPKIVVSDAYALVGRADEVVVFVEMLNNPGITGVTLKILYDTSLKFARYETGSVLDGGVSAVNATVPGVIKFTIGSAAADADSGYFLKLVFRVPTNAPVGAEYALTAVSQDSKVTDKNGQAFTLFIQSGVIRVVNHLPGDVNSDGCVDVLDAVLLARRTVDFKEPGFNPIYADVNLDRRVDVEDLVLLLRHIVGGFGQQVLSNEYKLYLNTGEAGVEYDYVDIVFRNVDGSYGKYPALPQLVKDGYRFDGWYTAFVGGEKIEQGDYIVYNRSQSKQMLYARFTLNKVSFDSNNGSGTMSAMTYNNSGEIVTLTNQFTKSTNVYFDYVAAPTGKSETVKHSFLGWSDKPDGEVLFADGKEINLKSDDIGTITLYAIWSQEQVKMRDIALEGFEFHAWSTDITGFDKIDGDYYVIDNNHQGILNIYAQWKRDFRVNYDGNGGWVQSASENVITKYSDPEEIETRSTTGGSYLEKSRFERLGYIQVGWSQDKAATSPQFELEGEIKGVTNIGTDLYITIYAVWKPIEYTFTYHANNGTNQQTTSKMQYDQPKELARNTFTKTGYTFVGWGLDEHAITAEYTDRQLVYISSTQGENTNLYAIWTANKYTVIFETDGGNGNMLDQTMTYDQTIALNANAFVKDPYLLAGWATDPDSKKIVFVDGEKVANLTSEQDGEVRLYAVWKLELRTSIELNNVFISEVGEAYDHAATFGLSLNNYFNLEALAAAGHTKMSITATFSIKDDGSASWNEFYISLEPHKTKGSSYLTFNDTAANGHKVLLNDAGDLIDGKYSHNIAGEGEDFTKKGTYTRKAGENTFPSVIYFVCSAHGNTYKDWWQIYDFDVKIEFSGSTKEGVVYDETEANSTTYSFNGIMKMIRPNSEHKYNVYGAEPGVVRIDAKQIKDYEKLKAQEYTDITIEIRAKTSHEISKQWLYVIAQNPDKPGFLEQTVGSGKNLATRIAEYGGEILTSTTAFTENMTYTVTTSMDTPFYILFGSGGGAWILNNLDVTIIFSKKSQQ